MRPQRFVELVSTGPARIFGLYPRKGSISVGADADLVIFDPARSHTVPAKNVYTKVDYSLYEGRRCLGAPTMVFQRGNLIMADGDIKAHPGQGKYVAGSFDS